MSNTPESKKPDLTAQEAAVEALKRRDHSAQELHKLLISKGFSEKDADSTRIWAHRRRYIDEGRSIAVQKSAAERRGRGPEWLRAQLERRQFAPALVSEAVRDAENGARGRAQQIVERKFGLITDANRARAFRFLLSRGFGAMCAREAVDADYTD